MAELQQLFQQQSNPFVSDIHYFSSVAILDKKGDLNSFRRVNDYVSLCLCLLFCPMLIYMALSQTPKNLKPYRKIFMLSMVVSLVQSISNFLIQMRTRSYNGYTMITYMGLLSRLGYRSYCWLNLWQTAVPVLAAATLPVQYYMRYATLKSQFPPTTLHMLAYFLLSASLISILCYSSHQLYCPGNPPNPEGIDCAPLWFKEDPIPPILVGKVRSPDNLLHQLADNVLFVFYMLISLALAYLTTNELQKNSAEYNGKVRTVQRQLGRVFFAQSILFCVLASTGRLLGVLSSFFNLFGGESGELVAVLQIWQPLYSLFCILFFIRNYRSYCLQFFCFYSPAVHQSVSGTTGPVVFVNGTGNSMSTSHHN